MSSCKAKDTPDTTWAFCPNTGVAYFFAVFFGLLFVVHIIQAFIYRKLYSLVIILSAALQVAVFVCRILSINNPTSVPFYISWFVIILVAPLFTNAYVYMIMGRMVHNFHPERKLCGMIARRFGLYFVLLDIVAFFVQASGAIVASGENVPPSQIKTGLNVYMAGIGFQQLFIFVFMAMAITFQRRIAQDLHLGEQVRALRLLYVLYAVLAFITIRIIFRLIEYSKGMEDNPTLNQEAYMYVFDVLPMWIAIFLFNVIHPGRYMPGKECDLPSRKEYRRERKAQKAFRNGEGPPIETGFQNSAYELSSKSVVV